MCQSTIPGRDESLLAAAIWDTIEEIWTWTGDTGGRFGMRERKFRWGRILEYFVGFLVALTLWSWLGLTGAT